LKITLVIELLEGGVGRKAVGEAVRELELANARVERLRCVLNSRHDMVSWSARLRDLRRA
jgi:hypothetical protein